MAMVAALGLGLALAFAQIAHLTPLAQDAWVYYRAEPGHLYGARFVWGDAPYGYSPAFADALIPFRLLPERVFLGLSQLALVIVFTLTVRGWALPLVAAGYVIPELAPLGAGEVAMANVQIVLGAVAVYGLRWPALWSFALLSKVTPGVGLVWFVARREWRNLTVALGVTAVIAAASFLFNPGDWFAWVRFLTGGSPDFPLWTVPVPLSVRLGMSAVAVWWAARTDRPWVVPVAVGWAIPIAYPTMVTTMVCALAYVGVRREPRPRG